MTNQGYWIAKADKVPEAILERIPVSNIHAKSIGRVCSTANCTADVDEIPAGKTFFWFFHLTRFIM